MRRQSAPQFPYGRNRGRVFSQYYAQPSLLAREIWTYALGIGACRLPKDYHTENPGRTMGYLLHYVRSGELEHMVHGVSYPVRTGSACLFDYSQGHRVRNHHGSTRLWWVMVNGKDMPRVFAELNADHDPVFRMTTPPLFEALFHQLWDLVSEPPVGYDSQAHVVLQRMLGELFLARLDRERAPSPIDNKMRLSEPILTVVNLLERLYYRDLTLKDAADVAHLNLNYFMRKFHKEVGMSCMQYLTLFRMEQAKLLLRTTNKRMGEISRLVGIQDSSYFARTFRRVTGRTPQQYRVESATKTSIDTVTKPANPGPIA